MKFTEIAIRAGKKGVLQYTPALNEWKCWLVGVTTVGGKRIEGVGDTPESAIFDYEVAMKEKKPYVAIKEVRYEQLQLTELKAVKSA